MLWLLSDLSHRRIIYASVSGAIGGRTQFLRVDTGQITHEDQKEYGTRQKIQNPIKDHLRRGRDGVTTLRKTPADRVKHPDERDERSAGEIPRSEIFVSKGEEENVAEELIPRRSISTCDDTTDRETHQMKKRPNRPKTK